ncbi:MAG TPA: hypothetical protein PKE23_10350 [Anaerolineales bacterium]|nr:hypothetical protein [Anaerolineales bacterium]
MKKYILFFALLSLSCSSLIPTPDDFPEPPMTVIVEDFPTLVITPTVETRIAVITSDKMADAQTFQLILLTMVAAGDSLGIAEMVKYPLSVNLDDTSLILNADEFEENYDRLFTEQVIEVISDTSESNLTLLPEGVRVGRGEIWFNLFCMDAACSETQFFITQINN